MGRVWTRGAAVAISMVLWALLLTGAVGAVRLRVQSRTIGPRATRRRGRGAAACPTRTG